MTNCHRLVDEDNEVVGVELIGHFEPGELEKED